jgi:hypothetical protein
LSLLPSGGTWLARRAKKAPKTRLARHLQMSSSHMPHGRNSS